MVAMCAVIAGCRFESANQENRRETNKAIAEITRRDELWASVLLRITDEGLRQKQLDSLKHTLGDHLRALHVVELREEGVDCQCVLLQRREITEASLLSLARRYSIEPGVIRFLDLTEKSGYVKALIALVERYAIDHKIRLDDRRGHSSP